LGIDHADENKLKIKYASNSTTGASPTYGENIISIATNGDVGIGTSSPTARLKVADGDIYISDINHGIIMKSPDGQCWRGTLDNSGNLSFTSINCPGEIQSSADFKSAATNENVSIFPNPIGNTVTMASLNGNFKNANAVIYTMEGKAVSKNELNGDSAIVSLNNIPSGSYVIRVTDKRGKELGSQTVLKNNLSISGIETIENFGQ
jgi:hypothetical protein